MEGRGDHDMEDGSSASRSGSESRSESRTRRIPRTSQPNRRTRSAVPPNMRQMTSEILGFLREETGRAKAMDMPRSETSISDDEKHLEQLQLLESLCDMEAMCNDLHSRGGIPILFEAAVYLQDMEMAEQCLLILAHFTNFLRLAPLLCHPDYLPSVILLLKSRDSAVLHAAVALIAGIMEMNDEVRQGPDGDDEEMEMGSGEGAGQRSNNGWMRIFIAPPPAHPIADDFPTEAVGILSSSRDQTVLLNALKMVFYVVDWRFGTVIEEKLSNRLDLREAVCHALRKLQYHNDFDTEELEHGWGTLANFVNSACPDPLTPNQAFTTQLVGLITRFTEQNLKDGRIYNYSAGHVLNIVNRIAKHKFFGPALNQYPELVRPMLGYLAKVEPNRRPIGADVTDIYGAAFAVLDAVAREKVHQAADLVLRNLPVIGVAKTRMEGLHWRTLEGCMNAISSLNPEKFARLRTRDPV